MTEKKNNLVINNGQGFGGPMRRSGREVKYRDALPGNSVGSNCRRDKGRYMIQGAERQANKSPRPCPTSVHADQFLHVFLASGGVVWPRSICHH